MTAFADVSPIPGCSFSYDFTASVVTEATTVCGEQVCPGDVAVTFTVTNNPGTRFFSFMILVGDGYDYLETENHDEFKNPPLCLYNQDMNRYIYTQIGENDISTNKMAIRYGTGEDFCVTVYFRPNENITRDNSNFSIAMLEYDTPSLNKPFSINVNDATSNIQVSGPSSYPYIVGDINGDEYISVGDASNISSIAIKSNILGDNSVMAINQYRLTDEWISLFPKLRCAEVADADGNKIVDNADVDAVLYYYSHGAAGVPIESIIGKTQFKEIYKEDIF